MSFNDYLNIMGLRKGYNIIVHSSFNKIKSAFSTISPEEIINILKKCISAEGSIVFPVFTYCFKKSTGQYEIFNKFDSGSKTGLLSEQFRLSKKIVRTSSPTHSFALWGKIKRDFREDNSPDSPLGKGSILEWFTYNPDSYVLMLGTDFSSLTYGHYIEIEAKVPWFDYSPWEYMNVLPIGVSIDGEQKLKEIPGCAKGFVNFEKYLLDKNLIQKFTHKNLSSYLISIKLLYDEGLVYFINHYKNLLCAEKNCPACESRRKIYL